MKTFLLDDLTLSGIFIEFRKLVIYIHDSSVGKIGIIRI